jgi:glycerol-3-phosphate acyltransferase PlsX
VIALDAHGADAGAAAVAAGARLAGLPVLAFGPRGELTRLPAGSEVVDAAAVPAGEPARAVRANPDCSIALAARAVADARAEALVSAGSTGATLAAAVLHVRRLRGVHRPAIAVPLPLPAGRTLLLDAGANADVRPEHLVQFAHMGTAFTRAVDGIAEPTVGLLSVGAEPGKGSAGVIAAHRALAASPAINFSGNVEGTDLALAAVDVVVTDGFTGNVALKTLEGTARAVGGAVREAIGSGVLAGLGGLLLRGRLAAVRARMDPNSVGGAILLGLRRPVVIAHGASTAEGIAQALRVARAALDERVVERTFDALEQAGALRSAPAASVAGP